MTSTAACPLGPAECDRGIQRLTQIGCQRYEFLKARIPASFSAETFRFHARGRISVRPVTEYVVKGMNTSVPTVGRLYTGAILYRSSLFRLKFRFYRLVRA